MGRQKGKTRLRAIPGGRSPWRRDPVPNPRGRRPYHPAPRGSRPGRWLKRLILLVVVFGISLPVVGDAVNGMVKPHAGCRIVGLTDGDTGTMFCPGIGFVKGRFLGFDTPELIGAQCLSERLRAVAATYRLRWELWRGGEIVARPRSKDRYGRHLTVLAIDGENPGRILVEAGLARWYDGGKRLGWCG